MKCLSRPEALKPTGRNCLPSQYWGPNVLSVVSSRAATTTNGRPVSILAHGQIFTSAARICSNCQAVLRPDLSPASVTTVKCALLTSSHRGGAGVAETAASIVHRTRAGRRIEAIIVRFRDTVQGGWGDWAEGGNLLVGPASEGIERSIYRCSRTNLKSADHCVN